MPFMIGKYIHKEDLYWENYLIMLRITNYLMAPEVTSDEISYITILIEEHHSNFCTLYPNASIIPKMHYLVHMPRLVTQ